MELIVLFLDSIISGNGCYANDWFNVRWKVIYFGQGIGQMRTDLFSVVPDTTHSTLIASSSTVLLCLATSVIKLNTSCALVCYLWVVWLGLLLVSAVLLLLFMDNWIPNYVLCCKCYFYCLSWSFCTSLFIFENIYLPCFLYKFICLSSLLRGKDYLQHYKLLKDHFYQMVSEYMLRLTLTLVKNFTCGRFSWTDLLNIE